MVLGYMAGAVGRQGFKVNIEDDFKSVCSEEAFSRFLSLYEFSELPATPKWNLGAYQATHDEQTYHVGYRWHDPSQAFSIQRDIHKAELSRINTIGESVVLAGISFEESDHG